MIDTNQGLYLKLGQALGLQAALLPKPYREAFGHVFDRAPSVSYEEVVKVFMDDLGVGPEDLFDEFSKEPLASASIAQVHKARLKGSGIEVAVKVQKPAIRKQMEWDLFSYRSLMWLAERIFDMPSECYSLGVELAVAVGSCGRTGVRAHSCSIRAWATVRNATSRRAWRMPPTLANLRGMATWASIVGDSPFTLSLLTLPPEGDSAGPAPLPSSSRQSR